MYEHNKEVYLNGLNITPESRKTYESWFNRAAKYEEKYNTDLCNFTEEQIKSFCLDNATSPLQMYNGTLLFEKYTDWCNEQGISNDPNVNEYQKFTVQKISDIMPTNKDTRYSEMQILEMANGLTNVCDKFLLAAPFYGFQKAREAKDFAELKKTDIDVDSGMIHLYNRTITASKQFCQWGRDSFDCYTYYTPLKELTLYGDGIVKSKQKVNTFDIRNVLTLKYARDFPKLTDKEISFEIIQSSGMLYYIKLKMLLTGETDLMHLLKSPAFEDFYVRFDLKNTGTVRNRLRTKFTKDLQL